LEVIPAVDLRHGRCVRLYQGDYGRETVFGDDPIAMAQHWREQGASRLHVVDLDAAAGEPQQAETIAGIIGAVAIPVQVGGGLRSREAVRRMLELGAERIVVGTAALRDQSLVSDLSSTHSNELIVAVDARNGQVAVDGWRETTSIAASDFMYEMATLGVKRFLYTDISRDATLEGPNFEELSHLMSRVKAQIIAAGGVGSLGHIRRLATLNVEAVVVGQALYSGAFSLLDAISIAEAEFVEE
jgi:phosphoribosylformimino-5-aminoimidazole carboxamide ribotide isomerase